MTKEQYEHLHQRFTVLITNGKYKGFTAFAMHEGCPHGRISVAVDNDEISLAELSYKSAKLINTEGWE